MRLTCHEEEVRQQDKKEAFNYFFKHEDIVEIPLADSQHKQELITDYGDYARPSITIKLIRGYKSSKWDRKQLLYRLRTKQIGYKKTNYHNQKFECFHLRGLLPLVKEHALEL